MTTPIFHSGDGITVTATHLLCTGEQGTVHRWLHDHIYLVHLDNGHSVVLKADEMSLLND